MRWAGHHTSVVRQGSLERQKRREREMERRERERERERERWNEERRRRRRRERRRVFSVRFMLYSSFKLNLSFDLVVSALVSAQTRIPVRGSEFPFTRVKSGELRVGVGSSLVRVSTSVWFGYWLSLAPIQFWFLVCFNSRGSVQIQIDWFRSGSVKFNRFGSMSRSNGQLSGQTWSNLVN
ncbi:hypothetical protein Hanom_Chr16g01508211 [Helianthus anomalus]